MGKEIPKKILKKVVDPSQFPDVESIPGLDKEQAAKINETARNIIGGSINQLSEKDEDFYALLF